MVTMEERKTEIATALTVITEICNSTNIALVAKNHKGTLMVAIQDNKTGKVYALCRDKEADNGR